MPVKPCPPVLNPNRRRFAAGLAGLAAALAAGKFSAAQSETLPEAIDLMTRMMPQAAPALKFTTASGRHLTLADYAGHALVVNLWATWCGPCVDELPSLGLAAAALKPYGVQVLPISIDASGAEAVTPFYARIGIHDLPVLLDPDGNNMQVLNTNGIPCTVVINAGGQMVARLDGAADWNSPRTLKFLESLGSAPAASGFTPV